MHAKSLRIRLKSLKFKNSYVICTHICVSKEFKINIYCCCLQIFKKVKRFPDIIFLYKIYMNLFLGIFPTAPQCHFFLFLPIKRYLAFIWFVYLFACQNIGR